MVDTALIPAIKEAIKQNEIGNASQYELSYARLGTSGASFGVFQGDTNVSHAARATLAAALRARGADEGTVTRILGGAYDAPTADGAIGIWSASGVEKLANDVCEPPLGGSARTVP